MYAFVMQEILPTYLLMCRK